VSIQALHSTSASCKIYCKRYYMRLSSRVLIQDDAQSIQLGRRIIYGLVNESNQSFKVERQSQFELMERNRKRRRERSTQKNDSRRKRKRGSVQATRSKKQNEEQSETHHTHLCAVPSSIANLVNVGKDTKRSGTDHCLILHTHNISRPSQAEIF